MGLDLLTQIGKIKLKNPVLVASGTFGHAREFEKFIDLKQLGGIVTKTITLKPRLGNPPQRIVETPSGMLNAIGLQNPGVDKFITDKMPFLRETGVPVIVSVMAYAVPELVLLVEALEDVDGIDGYEVNLSCPNVSYSTSAAKSVVDRGLTDVRMFAHDEKLIEEAVGAVRKATQRTLIAKLGPDVSNIGKMAQAAEKTGADAVALINTFVAMKIDINTRKLVLANKTGGLSGPCIRPIAVRLVWEAAKAVKIPIVGIGGIMNGDDAVEMMMAGASAIQVGTANFMNPRASIDVLEGIEDFMKKKKIDSIGEIVRSVKA